MKHKWTIVVFLFVAVFLGPAFQASLLDAGREDHGLFLNSDFAPIDDMGIVPNRMARFLKSQFFASLTGGGDKQNQATGESGKHRDRITALFIKLLTRLFRQRPFQRLLCGSNATCLAGLNTQPTY